MVLVEGPAGRRELVDAEGRVIVAVVVEIAGDLKCDSCGMGRLRPMSSQPLRVIRRSSHSVRTWSVTLRSPQSRVATLQACERPRLPPGRLIPIIGM